ncbi:MAG: hypothetical protein OEV44_11965 [Spirochaetota bacterium]|nr:hypothetical protein [Spirochaetota bacterium]
MWKKLGWFVIICMFVSSGIEHLYSFKWDVGLKAISLNMTIKEVEEFLYKYRKNLKSLSDYNSINYYFLEEKGNLNSQYLYYNDSQKENDIQVSQINESNLKVALKKVFGIKIGSLQWLDGSKVSADSSLPYIFQIVYHYHFIPLAKINSLLESVEFSFYNERLFKVLYLIKVTSKEYRYLLDHLKKDYQEITPNYYQKGEKMVHITPITQPGNEMIKIRIEYSHRTLTQECENYLIKSEKKVKELIEKSKYKELEQF